MTTTATETREDFHTVMSVFGRLQAGTPLTFAEVREYIRKSIDVIVQLGRAEGKRGITEFYLPGAVLDEGAAA